MVGSLGPLDQSFKSLSRRSFPHRHPGRMGRRDCLLIAFERIEPKVRRWLHEMSPGQLASIALTAPLLLSIGIFGRRCFQASVVSLK